MRRSCIDRVTQPAGEKLGQLIGLAQSLQNIFATDVSVPAPPSYPVAKVNTPRPLGPIPVRGTRPVSEAPKPAVAGSHRSAPRTAGTEGTQAHGKMERTMLSVLAQYRPGLSTRQIEIHTTYTLSGGSGASALARMRAAAWVETGADRINRITDLGLEALGPYEELPTGRALRQHWLAKLGKTEATLLSAICDVYPRGLTTAELSEATGYVLSGGSGASALAKLRGLGLVAGKPIVASEELF
jgi:hypothetical protein